MHIMVKDHFLGPTASESEDLPLGAHPDPMNSGCGALVVGNLWLGSGIDFNKPCLCFFCKLMFESHGPRGV